MNGNDFIAWVLRSPLHGLLSNGMMLITVTGRKTGRKYTTPIGYYREGEALWVLTSRDRTWWRNLRDGAKVELLLKHESVTAFANLELNEEAIKARMLEYLRHTPQAAKPLKIQVKNGMANMEAVERVAQTRLFVKIKPG